MLHMLHKKIYKEANILNSMRRKLIKQKESFTLTIPKKWITDNKLQGDEEVELLSEGKNLIISSPQAHSKKETTVSFTEDNYNILRSKLAILYSRGYDSINIQSSHKLQPGKMLSLAESFNGAVLLEQTSHDATIEIITKETVDAQKLIEKAFTMVSYMLSITNSKEIAQFSISVNRLANYSSRVLYINKYGDERNKDYSFLAYNLSRFANILEKKSSKGSRFKDDEISNLFLDIKSAFLKKDPKKIIETTDKIANKRREIIFNDPLDTLFFEYLYLISSITRNVLL